MSILRVDQAAVTRVVSAGTVTVAWWGLLGWDTQRYRGEDGNLHGPYSTAQVATFVVVLFLVAIWTGIRRDVVVSTAMAAAAAAVSFSVSAQMYDSVGASMWGVGAVMTACGVFIGSLTVESIARCLASLSRSRSR